MCNKEFTHIKHYSGKRKICSKECLSKWNSLVQSNKKSMMCNFCNEEFEYSLYEEKTKKYCSKKCRDLAKIKNYEFICEECNEKFISKEKKRKFCSIKCLCRNNNKTGKTFNKKINTKPEIKFAKILQKLNIQYIQSYTLPYKKSYKVYDFYIPSKNLLVEIDGIYWHAKNIKKSDMNEVQKHNKNNDLLKNKLAKTNGYNLFRLWSDEITYENVMEMLNE
jgi:very-short-patch-repair endonuclease